jgi:hypothetical protein
MIGLPSKWGKIRPYMSISERSSWRIAQYSDRRWEADILPGAVIEDALDGDVRSWLDDKLWDRRDREIERARGLQ